VAREAQDSEKGATWTDWIPTSFRLSRSAILRECSPCPRMQAIEALLRLKWFFRSLPEA
jgi:hypothetical protein